MYRIAVVCVAVAGLSASAAPIPKDAAKTNAEKIVGTWKMVKSTTEMEKDATVLVEFTKDGKLTIKRTPADAGGDPADAEAGTYKVDGDKLPYTFGGDDGRSATDEIKKLTDDELVLVDPDGNREEYVRVKPAVDGKK